MCERHYLEDGRWYRGCFCWAESTTPGDLHLSPWGPKTFIYLPRDKDLSKDISSPFILLFIYLFIWTFPRISLFPLHSITTNSRFSLMPILTGVSINYGLYFQANQEKYQGNCLWYKLLFFIGVFKISSKILTIDS